MVDWNYIDKKYPSSLDKSSLSEADYRKLRTNELYSYLPQADIPEGCDKKEKEEICKQVLAERFKYNDIRDAVVEMNYKFFGFIASHKFINNSSVDYEDKFQSALFHFCEMWHKYKFAAKYRTDLAFGVFFKPRITECMERELDEVKYSLRRTLCMEVGNQLGKHWAKVSYEDLADPSLKLAPEKLASLQAIFGSMYTADLETHAMFIEADRFTMDPVDLYSDNYDSIVDMLIHEMVTEERCLEDKDILDLAMMLDIPYATLQKLMPKAKDKLYKILTSRLDIIDTFN